MPDRGSQFRRRAPTGTAPGSPHDPGKPPLSADTFERLLWVELHAPLERRVLADLGQSAPDAFARCVTEAQAPPLTARDTRIRDDPEWLSAAAAYLEAKRAADTMAAALDEAKAKLVQFTDHAKEQGGRVSVTRPWKRGSVEYKREPELAGVDLEQYRGAEREEVRVLIER